MFWHDADDDVNEEKTRDQGSEACHDEVEDREQPKVFEVFSHREPPGPVDRRAWWISDDCTRTAFGEPE